MSTATDTVRDTSGSLLERVRASDRQGISRLLDGMRPSMRVEHVLGITGSDVGRLYDAVGGNEPLRLEDIVPADEKGTVILEGRNSLPVFTRFQKRFARVGDAIVGYNHQLMSFATGPGYFITRSATLGEAHPDELFFDYTVEPPGVPTGWPAFKANGSGLSRAVYMNMKDFCRRVANGVLVGKAYKRGVSQNAYFTLTKPY